MKSEPISRGVSGERVIDRLHCERGERHDVRMEWETRGGIRTGRLVGYCWTCRRETVAAASNSPTAERTANLNALEAQRLLAAERKAEAHAREAALLDRREAGEMNTQIAASLGLTVQRVSQIICRARRRRES